MSSLAPTLQAFFTERLMTQRQASPHTITAYRDAFRLLLSYVQDKTGTAPSRLDFADLDRAMIGAFLDHLERARGNSVRTRNARLAALHSFFRFAALRHPEHAAILQQVLAIPGKRYDSTLVCFLTPPEVDALLASPDRSTWTGRRDHALLLLAAQTGLRVSELTGLRCSDVALDTGPRLHCYGKGRKERCVPLTALTTAALRVWMKERNGRPGDPLFPSRRGSPLSRDAVERLVAKHADAAQRTCPSLHGKRVTPMCCATPRPCPYCRPEWTAP